MQGYGGLIVNYKNYKDAYEAAQKMRKQYGADGILVKIERSPYSGFQVKLVSIDLMIDNLSNNLQNGKSNQPTACC